MKKILLSVCVIIAGAFSASAQATLLYQSFNGKTSVAAAGFTDNTTTPANGGWNVNGNFNGSAFMQGAIGSDPNAAYCAYVDDYDANPGDQTVASRDTLYTSVINCSSASNVFLSFDYQFWIDDGSEVASVLINNGSGWQQVTSLANTNQSWSDSNEFDISTWAGGQASVRIAFVYYNGYPLSGPYVATCMCVSDIGVFAAAQYGVATNNESLNYLMQVGSPYTFTGTSTNTGYAPITQMDIDYSVNGGTPVVSNLTGITGFGEFTSVNWTLPGTSNFTPSAEGLYKVKFWSDNIDGANPDGTPAVDTFYQNFLAISNMVQKTPLMEEFMNASCNPCMYATPNVDSVMHNNPSVSEMRYHVWFPGRDFMDDETKSLFVSDRVNYYGVNGVPDAKVDGLDIYPGAGYLSSAVLQQEATTGSPFTIDILTAHYNPVSGKFTIYATVKSNTTSYVIPAGLVAQAAISVDTIKYSKNQSEEDPDKDFVSPIGTGTDALYLRSGLLNFPSVVEDMVPSDAGTTLTSFAPGSSQVLNLTWTKNHAWGSNPKGNNAALGDTSLYDSTLGYHLTVFVQSSNPAVDQGIGTTYGYVMQSASAVVYVTTGLEELSNSVYFEMYPNPTNNTTNIAFKLEQSQNVNIEVYNMLGQQVYAENEGQLGAGQYIVPINANNLQSGVYMVKFNTDNATTTKKLIIQK